jgi:hypothetical protein
LIVLLNGGMGWTSAFEKAGSNEGGLFGVLMDLPLRSRDSGNYVALGQRHLALLVPQRGFLMGLPLA